MRSHQAECIRTLYPASRPGGEMHDAYRAWLADIELSRGPLDRKKKVPASQLEKLIGSYDDDNDLSRYIFAVELYLQSRAIGLIQLCSAEAGADAETIEQVRSSTATLLGTNSLLQREAPDSWHAELSERDDLLLADGPLRDVFQDEYMSLVPRQVRHAIGAFYTPHWLARHVLRTAGFRADQPESLRQKLVDPACGSGIFLIAAAEEIRQAVEARALPSAEGLTLINDLRGVDLGSTASLAAIASLVLATWRIWKQNPDLPFPLPLHIETADSLEYRGDTSPVDLIIGNPPWVNWEYMPEQFRERHGNLWPFLGIFSSQRRSMGYSKEDISALFVAHSIFSRLRSGGTYGFLLPESLIKSSVNHREFRRFRVGPKAEPFRVTLVEDFVKPRPFEGVSNRTIALYGEKGQPTTYPVPFRKWEEVAREGQPVTGSNALNGTARDGVAQLAKLSDECSSWSTGDLASVETHRYLDGSNHYRARTGLFTGGANGVFHLRILADAAGGSTKISNVIERAKRPVPQVEAEIETAHVYPFLRGRDVAQWHFQSELSVVLPHTATTRMAAIPRAELAETAPRTLAYFEQFRDVLDARKGFSRWENKYREVDFYACQRVGDYTFADWKVVWRYISKTFTTAVIGPRSVTAGSPQRPVIPNEKLMLIACGSSDEAYYVGGVLAGSVVIEHVQSRMISTQVSPSIIAGIGLPAWDPSDDIHKEISALCRAGHENVEASLPVDAVVSLLDIAVASLWGLDASAANSARQRIEGQSR